MFFSKDGAQGSAGPAVGAIDEEHTDEGIWCSKLVAGGPGLAAVGGLIDRAIRLVIARCGVEEFDNIDITAIRINILPGLAPIDGLKYAILWSIESCQVVDELQGIIARCGGARDKDIFLHLLPAGCAVRCFWKSGIST